MGADLNIEPNGRLQPETLHTPVEGQNRRLNLELRQPMSENRGRRAPHAEKHQYASPIRPHARSPTRATVRPWAHWAHTEGRRYRSCYGLRQHHNGRGPGPLQSSLLTAAAGELSSLTAVPCRMHRNLCPLRSSGTCPVNTANWNVTSPSDRVVVIQRRVVWPSGNLTCSRHLAHIRARD